MVIKSLDKPDNRGLGLKIGFLIALLVTGFVIGKIGSKPQPLNVLGETEVKKNNTNPPIEKEAAKFIKETSDNLINTAVDTVTSFASQSAATVSDIILDNTVVGVMKQIDKLPARQQAEIKNAICK